MYWPTSITVRPESGPSGVTLGPDLQGSERDVDVDLQVARQADDAFGNDVAHDLVGTAANRRRGRAQQLRAPPPPPRVVGLPGERRRSRDGDGGGRRVLHQLCHRQLEERSLTARAAA